MSLPGQGIHGIYVVTDGGAGPERDHAAIAVAAVRGGAGCVQFRDKNLPDRQLLEVAQKIRAATRGTDTLFIVNNRLDLALACGADGLHIGQDDLPASTARALLGPHAVLGVSVGSVEESLQAEADGASYVAISPVFTTPTKPDAGEGLGLEAVTGIRRAVRLSVVAIGGISLGNIASVAAAGADAAAAVSAVVAAPDMVEAVRELAREFERGRSECAISSPQYPCHSERQRRIWHGKADSSLRSE